MLEEISVGVVAFHVVCGVKLRAAFRLQLLFKGFNLNFLQQVTNFIFLFNFLIHF